MSAAQSFTSPGASAPNSAAYFEYAESPTEVTAKCQIPLSKIKTLFPLTEVIKKKDQVTAQDIFQDNHEEAPSSKKLKTEEEEAHFRISSLAEGSVTRVGSVTPAENFRVLVRQKKASFEEASHQLISHIEQFLDTNETPYFMKSMDCIKVFREEAIQFSEEQRFNSFLRALRESGNETIKSFLGNCHPGWNDSDHQR